MSMEVFQICDRCKRINEEAGPDAKNLEAGWNELKFTYVSKRWDLCPPCVEDFGKFITNEAVLPVKVIRRETA